jgi:hypothetical protein
MKTLEDKHEAQDIKVNLDKMDAKKYAQNSTREVHMSFPMPPKLSNGVTRDYKWTQSEVELKKPGGILPMWSPE